MANRTCSLDERFAARVDKSDPTGCWPWTGGKTQGYGVFNLGARGRKIRAHRYAYERAHGTIPDGMLVDHRCWNRACVNPAHLRLVDRVENAQNVPGPPRNNRSGERGVFWDERRRVWITYADLRGVRTYGDTFDNYEAAARAARDLRNRLHSHNDSDRVTS